MVKYITTPCTVGNTEERVTLFPRVSVSVKSGAFCPTAGPVVPGCAAVRLSLPDGLRSSITPPHATRVSNKSSQQHFLTKNIAYPQGIDVGRWEVLSPPVLADGVTPASTDAPVVVCARIGDGSADRFLAEAAGGITNAVNGPIRLVQIGKRRSACQCVATGPEVINIAQGKGGRRAVPQFLMVWFDGLSVFPVHRSFNISAVTQGKRSVPGMQCLIYIKVPVDPVKAPAGHIEAAVHVVVGGDAGRKEQRRADQDRRSQVLDASDLPGRSVIGRFIPEIQRSVAETACLGG